MAERLRFLVVRLGKRWPVAGGEGANRCIEIEANNGHTRHTTSGGGRLLICQEVATVGLWNEHASPKPHVRSQRGVIIDYSIPPRLHPLSRFSNT